MSNCILQRSIAIDLSTRLPQTLTLLQTSHPHIWQRHWAAVEALSTEKDLHNIREVVMMSWPVGVC